MARETRVRTEVREVYFVRAKTLGHIKIGVANDAWLRFLSLDSSSPDELELMGVIRSTQAIALEETIHIRFSADRHRREWFRASDALLAFIAANAKDRDAALAEEIFAAVSQRAKSKPGRKPGWRERQVASLAEGAS